MTTVPGSLEDLIASWSAAERAGDAAALASLLDDGFLAVGPRGYLRDKGQWVTRYSSKTVVNTSFALGEQVVRLFGDTAIVTIAQSQSGTNDGKDTTGTFRFTLVAQRRGSQWSIVGLFISPRPDAIG
ncbi:nuclear transport factor 2 family protein [Amycolatopsis keratiniphila]|uniref:DUF4440 domain-containing protein n=1 Tax=Amycolatopsis keratiniphila subsp. keratiniphila TaxID=227715 RepID=A0A1W2M322_9PSEU|nr:nuclear transport factor 2 family protein [Amycolatopsis keratiniphila]ONF74390.1 hypothetical protein AVR91_0203645 [Amycolatopsis keratiniphila subsp. keratiniphila]